MSTSALIKDLKSSKLIAKCHKCDRDFKLADSLLFDVTKTFPKEAEEIKQKLVEAFQGRETNNRNPTFDNSQQSSNITSNKVLEKEQYK